MKLRRALKCDVTTMKAEAKRRRDRCHRAGNAISSPGLSAGDCRGWLWAVHVRL